ncbi:MAG: acetyl-CoA carboxylase biotin carboxyl carrier protein [Ruminococcus sp.]|nr:acetyl-CoA carboxylase biotin carboxyl carrier protein [Ruminococcus sp.]
MIDIETLKEYIKVLEDSSLTCIEISDEEDSIRLERELYSPDDFAAAAGAQTISSAAKQSAVHSDSGVSIKSPMVGVFYAAPSPDKPAFVSVGDRVEKGQVVCIIEAMKIMNEITADKSGTVCEILVDNGDVVEFDQPLFKLN